MTYENYSYRQLLQLHANTKSLLAKTRIEEAAWNKLTAEDRLKFRSRPVFVAEVLGGSQNEASNRMNLLNADCTDQFWLRIENGTMKIGTAVRLHRKARREAAVKNTPLDEAVNKALARYDKLPQTVDGIRKKKQSSHTRLDRGPRKRRRGRPPKQAGIELRQIIADYVRRQLPEGDLTDVGDLVAQLEADLKVAVDTFQVRLQHARSRVQKHARSATRQQLREAFETLLIEPPRRGKPIDIELVRKNKRRLAREYHPDMNRGDDSMAEAYRSVIDAAELIEAEWERQQQDQA